MTHIVFGLTTTTHDMYRKGSGIAILRDSDAVLQTVKTRLLLHYEEWFLDLSAGLPWFTDLMKHNPDFSLIESRISETITNTDGVASLKYIQLAFTDASRSLLVNFSYIDVYGITQTESQAVEL